MPVSYTHLRAHDTHRKWERLCSKVRENCLHTLLLRDMDRSAAVAVPAREAVLRGFFQRQIVFARQIVAELCQIVILVDQRNVESGRTRMAVLAVDAGAERGGSCKRGSFGLVALLRSRFKIGKDLAQLLFAAVAGKDGAVSYTHLTLPTTERV